MPQRFLTNESTAKDDFLKELSSYLQKIKLDADVSEEFVQDIKKEHKTFKASIIKKNLPSIEIANKYQSLHIGCNNYE